MHKSVGDLHKVTFGLPGAISRFPYEMNTSQTSRESEDLLHGWMFLCLRPSGWVHGQNQEFALCNERCQRMQKLHPGGQGSCLCNQDSVHGGRRPEGYRKP